MEPSASIGLYHLDVDVVADADIDEVADSDADVDTDPDTDAAANADADAAADAGLLPSFWFDWASCSSWC